MESKSDKLNPMDKLVFALIQLLIEKGLTKTQIFEYCLAMSDTKQQKYRMRCKLEFIWDNHILETEEGKKCDIFSEEIKAFGLK